MSTPEPRLRRGRLLLLVLAALLVAALVWAWLGFVTPYRVSSGSMRPTLCAGDRVLVDQRVAGGRGVHRDDLVVFTAPDDSALMVKRVVGLPGDVVEIRDALLYRDGEPVDEPYVDHDSIDGTYYGPVTVEPRHLLVMGDERASSIDSREFGAVPFERLTGRVRWRLWPTCSASADTRAPAEAGTG